jgi:hypothetical protein
MGGKIPLKNFSIQRRGKVYRKVFSLKYLCRKENVAIMILCP